MKTAKQYHEKLQRITAGKFKGMISFLEHAQMTKQVWDAIDVAGLRDEVTALIAEEDK